MPTTTQFFLLSRHHQELNHQPQLLYRTLCSQSLFKRRYENRSRLLELRSLRFPQRLNRRTSHYWCGCAFNMVGLSGHLVDCLVLQITRNQRVRQEVKRRKRDRQRVVAGGQQ